MTAARKKKQPAETPAQAPVTVPAHCMKCGADFRLAPPKGPDGFDRIPTASEIATDCFGPGKKHLLEVDSSG